MEPTGQFHHSASSISLNLPNYLRDLLVILITENRGKNYLQGLQERVLTGYILIGNIEKDLF